MTTMWGQSPHSPQPRTCLDAESRQSPTSPRPVPEPSRLHSPQSPRFYIEAGTRDWDWGLDRRSSSKPSSDRSRRSESATVPPPIVETPGFWRRVFFRGRPCAIDRRCQSPLRNRFSRGPRGFALPSQAIFTGGGINSGRLTGLGQPRLAHRTGRFGPAVVPGTGSPNMPRPTTASGGKRRSVKEHAPIAASSFLQNLQEVRVRRAREWRPRSAYLTTR